MHRLAALRPAHPCLALLYLALSCLALRCLLPRIDLPSSALHCTPYCALPAYTCRNQALLLLTRLCAAVGSLLCLVPLSCLLLHCPPRPPALPCPALCSSPCPALLPLALPCCSSPCCSSRCCSSPYHDLRSPLLFVLALSRLAGPRPACFVPHCPPRPTLCSLSCVAMLYLALMMLAMPCLATVALP